MTGAYVVAALKDPKTYIKAHGKDTDIRVITEIFTVRQVIQSINEVCGSSIKIKEVDEVAFDKSREIPDIEEIWTT